MSNRRWLNLSLTVTGALLLGVIAVVGTAARQDSAAAAQLAVASHQQQLISALVSHADSLEAGTGRAQALAARAALGRTIISFDQSLGALTGGGLVAIDGGPVRRVRKVDLPGARQALERASRIWIETGVPLGDLAAGQFSPFSAAGQQAIGGLRAGRTELAGQLTEAAESIRRGAAGRAQRSEYAQRAAYGLSLIGLVLLGARLWPARRRSVPAANGTSDPAAAIPTPGSRPAAGTDAPARRTGRAGRAATPAPSIDFRSVQAAVDQMTVDMGTIAGRSDTMRQAIDAVGEAMQGLLASLDEMAHDTSEGLKIVRNANNAATFTAKTATEMLESARDMSRIVARVAELANRTREVAAQVEDESARTGRTGEALTSVVAREVKGLAQQTSRATWEIDQTVGDVLATARQFEEAIGQIIKNVTAINLVSQNLGRLMLDPPPRVETIEPRLSPLPAAAAMRDAEPDRLPAQAAEPLVRIDDDPVAPEPTPTEVAVATDEAISEAAAEVEVKSAEPPTPAAEAPDAGSGSVFLLGRPRRKPTVNEVLDVADESPAGESPPPQPEVAEAAPIMEEQPASADAPTGEAATATTSAEGESSGNVFLLNRPKTPRTGAPATPEAASAPAAAGESAGSPEPQPKAAPPSAEEPMENLPTSPNIFMLNRPRKKTADAGTGAPATAVAEPTEGAGEPETNPWHD